LGKSFFIKHSENLRQEPFYPSISFINLGEALKGETSQLTVPLVLS